MAVQIENAIVVTLDICSSSQMIEDLLKNDRSRLWRDLIISTKASVSLDHLFVQFTSPRSSNRFIRVCLTISPDSKPARNPPQIKLSFLLDDNRINAPNAQNCAVLCPRLDI
jgi:hypothetical protein